MDIQTVMGHLNDTAGDVGAMVGHPLQAGQQVRPDKAQFNGTFPFLQPQNMPVPQLLLQGIPLAPMISPASFTASLISSSEKIYLT